MTSLTSADMQQGRFDKGAQFICASAFLLLFPGFFFYQTLIALNLIPAFLGGYFGIVSVAFALPLLYVYWTSYRKKRVDPFAGIEIYFFLFLAYFTGTVMVNLVFGADREIGMSQLVSVLFIFEMFVIFRLLDFRQKRLHRLLILAMLAMSGIILFFSPGGSFILTNKSDDLGNVEALASYQGFARSLLFTFIAVTPFIKRMSGRLVIYALAAAALYLNGSRTEFVMAVLSIPMIEIYCSRHRLAIIMTIMLLMVGLFANLQTLTEVLPENRMLELLDLSHASSAKTRQNLTENALRTISQNPWSGSYASYIPGQYAHNIVSAWVDLGFVGFAYMIGLLLIPIVTLVFKREFVHSRSAEFLLAAWLLCLAVVLLLTSRTFNDMIIGAAVGAYASYLGRKQLQRSAAASASALAHAPQEAWPAAIGR